MPFDDTLYIRYIIAALLQRSFDNWQDKQLTQSASNTKCNYTSLAIVAGQLISYCASDGFRYLKLSGILTRVLSLPK